MKTVDRESPQKLYVQMYSIIREKIINRYWSAGSQIPTEDELCKNFNVSKATVRMAISDLVRDGYLRRQQGKGTFVTKTTQSNGITMKTRLTEDMFGEGVIVKKELLVQEVQEPAEDVREVLRTSHAVCYILCKRVAEGETAYLEESFVPLDAVPGIGEQDVRQTTLYDIIQQKANKRIHKVIQSIEIGVAQGAAAAVLKTLDGSPVLLFHRLLVGADGSPIAYTRLMGSGRKYKLQTELLQIA